MRALAIALVVTACGKAKGTGPDDKPCAQRAAELGAWAIAIAPEGDATGPMPDVTLVDAPDAPLVAPGRVTAYLRVTRDGRSLDGQPADDDDDLRLRLLRDVTNVPADVSLRAQLWIDRSAPLARVAATADALARAGLGRAVEIVVERAAKSSTPPPPRSAISDQLAAILHADPSTRATQIAKLAQQVVASCPSYATLFGGVASVEPVSKAQYIARGLERATLDCDCKLDLDSLRSLLWDLVGPGDRPLMGAVAVTLAPADAPDARTITGATWADAAPAVIAAHGAPIRFAPR